ncbi:MAG: ParA family protein, partial [Planctomycetota bacterium]
GFGKLLQTIELVNKRINPNLKVNGILLCMFDSRASLPNEVKADIEQFLSKARGTNCAWAQARVLPTFIRRNIKLAEAPSYGKTIFEYEENCHGAEDYGKVAEFIHAGFPQFQPLTHPDTQPAAAENQAKPPIEIRTISPRQQQAGADSKTPEKFTQTTTEQNPPESGSRT